MALERRDGRFKMDPDVYEALAHVAEAHNMDIGEFVESEMAKIVRDEVHRANVIAARTASLEIPGIFRESQARPPGGSK
jgi:hypothetical protein